MDIASSIPTVTHAIQQSVAPVFLLTGVGSLLGVLTSRLGRIVDRHRALLALASHGEGGYRPEMTLLQRRSRLIHKAITFCTICALLICVVIALLFVAVELSTDLSTAVAAFFVLAMLSLIAGLLCFLREISLATFRLETPGLQFLPEDEAGRLDQ